MGTTPTASLDNEREGDTATLLLALCLRIAPPARASDHGPLELATAIQAALARSQALSAQDAAARSAREAAVAAGQRPDPVLRFAISAVRPFKTGCSRSYSVAEGRGTRKPDFVCRSTPAPACTQQAVDHQRPPPSWHRSLD